ncbi:MAG: putative RNA methyltransferase [Lactococcus sp.]
MSEMLKCPVCQLPLAQDERTFVCQQGHSFDLAKEGYLNLLLNAKPTAGDSKEMMAARRNFLATGYYQPLSDAVNQVLFEANQKKQAQSILDIGCGEGYYLSRFQNLSSEAMAYFGMDISKLGIRMAAKKNKNIQWLVGNFAHLPFQNQSIDLILSMFAEYSVAEMTRILADDGSIVIVRAGNQHLMELKQIIYPEIHEKAKAEVIKPFPDFNVDRRQVTFTTEITSNEDLMSLLLMTPHYWKIKPEGLENLKNYQTLTVTVNIEIDLLTRQND